MSRSAFVLRDVVLTLALVSLGACGTTKPIIDRFGYVPDEVQPQDVKPNEDTRTSVLARLGSPSTKSNFQEDAWYYISGVQQRRNWRAPETSERTVVVIRFGEGDLVQSVEKFGVERGQIISYATEETPTRGRELGVLEQLFGSVGRVPTTPQDEEGPRRTRN